MTHSHLAMMGMRHQLAMIAIASYPRVTMGTHHSQFSKLCDTPIIARRFGHTRAQGKGPQGPKERAHKGPREGPTRARGKGSQGPKGRAHKGPREGPTRA